jgi:1,4-dihydroxy-2-naphthoate octaprenyltransferase
MIVQIAWQVSIYLEALAILPQLTLLMRTENIDNLTGNYVFLLGAYRALYILNWIYRWATEPHYYHWLGAISCFVLFGLLLHALALMLALTHHVCMPPPHLCWIFLAPHIRTWMFVREILK